MYLIPKGVYYKYPVFNNNSALSNNESRMLFYRSVVEFCKNNINLNLAKELDLKGKTTVRVRACYNKSGEIENINTFSPHKVLNDAVREALKSFLMLILILFTASPIDLIFHSPFLLTNHLFIIQSLLEHLPHILVVNLQKQLSNQRNVQVIKSQSLLLKTMIQILLNK